MCVRTNVVFIRKLFTTAYKIKISYKVVFFRMCLVSYLSDFSFTIFADERRRRRRRWFIWQHSWGWIMRFLIRFSEYSHRVVIACQNIFLIIPAFALLRAACWSDLGDFVKLFCCCFFWFRWNNWNSRLAKKLKTKHIAIEQKNGYSIQFYCIKFTATIL